MNNDIPQQPGSHASAFRGWLVLIIHSFQRHWRVRQMGWVSVGLLAIVVVWVALVTSRNGWDFASQRARRSASTNAREAERLLPTTRHIDLGSKENRPLMPHELPNPLNPTANAITSLFLSIPQATIQSPTFRHNWAFMTYSRWVVMFVFVGFVLPLFTMSYATAAFGTERESRSLVWLMTRPIPRSGIYLAKLLGTLPWCFGFAIGGFVVVCSVGGVQGREAFVRFWPAVAASTLAYAAMFHLVGAVFRRPVVVGLVYVFFFETVIAALPGSLKLLSLTFYARSIIYNEVESAGYPTDMFPAMAEVVTSTTAWSVLLGASVVFTLVGMWLFARSEYRDDV